MRWWQLFLFPFALLYHMVTALRNHLYNIGYKPSFRFEANVIAVGNLSVGGTGKTPMVQYLVRNMLLKRRVAVLSRGYGRKTSGFKIVSAADDVADAGDEAVMIKSQFPEITVAVGEERVMAIPELLANDEKTEAIILDDAYQHRSVVPSFSILLTTYQHPFYNDYVLPMGFLREARIGAKRADVIVVSKCPSEISREEKEEIDSQIRVYAGECQVFFTGIKYGTPVTLKGNTELVEGDRVVAVSAIADEKLFEEKLSDKFSCIKAFRYRDHYRFPDHTITMLDEYATSNDAAIVLTEKDAVKWMPHAERLTSRVFILPVKVSFLEGEDEFWELLNSTIKSYDRET
jgi:tetraacyldisaccharide 4'-kinase